MSVSSYPLGDTHAPSVPSKRSPSQIYQQHHIIKNQAELLRNLSLSQHVPLAEAVRITPLLHTPLVAIDPEDAGLLDPPIPSAGAASAGATRSMAADGQSQAATLAQSVIEAKHPVSRELQSFYRIADRYSTPILTALRSEVGPVSRPMAIARRLGPDFLFLASSMSAVVRDLAVSPSVMLAFFDHDSQDWTSVTGQATMTGPEDRRIDECWYPGLQEWLANLGDGVHTGRPGDPRLCCLEIRTTHIVHYSDGNCVEVGEEQLRYAREVVGSRD